MPAGAATLTGTFTPLQGATVDLSAEGKLDWGHWGLVTEASYNHKYGVTPQISYSFTTDQYLNDGPYHQTSGTNAFSWNGGTPTLTATNTSTGIYILGDKLPGNTPTGFQIQCRADTTLKHLKLYVGTYNAQCTLSASLTGTSGSYSDSSLTSTTFSNGVYMINFQASSAGQTLTVTFTTPDNVGYSILQAATLAGPDVPPAVSITSPANGTVFGAPATFSVAAAASDPDGTITNLLLLKNSVFAAQATSGTLNVNFTNQPGNAYNLLAVASDNAGLSITSAPVTVYSLTGGGTLTGSVTSPTPAADLTAEGTVDWAHWGLTNGASFDRKAGVAQRISNVTPINATTNAFLHYGDDFTSYSWSDGTPTASESGSTTGIFIYGTNNPAVGFSLTVPATNTPRRLKLYVGLYSGQARLDAWLSDWSALPYSDSSLSVAYQNGYAIYSIVFASTNAGATLNVTWTSVQLFDANYGNITWQAATLADVPTLTCVSNRTVECGSAWDFIDPTGNHFCNGNTFDLSILNTVTNSACGNTFSATRTWQATDACGNSAACSQTVTVADTTPPVINCSTNQTVECGTSWDFTPPTATDACSGTNVVITVLSTATNSACGNTFSATRTWQAADPCGNSATGSQTITVVDTTPPILNCATNFSAAYEASWDFTPPTVFDACSGTDVSVSVQGTVTNATGNGGFTATRTWLATDGCGGSATCSQTVTVAPKVVNPPVLHVTGSAPFGFSFITQTDAFYTVLCAANPGATNWQPVTNFQGNGGEMPVTLPEETNQAQLFRVKAQ